MILFWITCGGMGIPSFFKVSIMLRAITPAPRLHPDRPSLEKVFLS